MNDWFETLEGTHDKVWARLTQAADERAQVSFATVSPDTMPEVRTVVLRDTKTDRKTVEIYTDSQSDKIASLRALPRAGIMFWDDDLAFQIRLQCDVSILTGAAVMDRWRAIPDHSKLSYGITPPPGQPIPQSDAYVKKPDPKAFAVLSCKVIHIDAVHLGKPHRRASFSRVGDWQGNWLAP